ncbi:MAG: protein SCO1/2 [Flavobacterium sp.]|jgi:protein SCO1/2
MKNKAYIGISFIILIFGIIVVPRVIDRIKNGSVVQNDRMSYKNEITKDTTLVVIGPAPKFEFIDQNNATITNQDYAGKVYVLEFFFSTCPSICPIMNKNMRSIEDDFGKFDDFGIASITINPANDTPKVLLQHAKDLAVTSKNWHFLTGDLSQVLKLSNEGFKIYGAQNEKVVGGFEHSGLFALIDKNGNIRCRKDEFNNPILYYDGLDSKGIKAIKEDIKLLLEE